MLRTAAVLRDANIRCASGAGPRVRRAAPPLCGPRRVGSRGHILGSGRPSLLRTVACGERRRVRKPCDQPSSAQATSATTITTPAMTNTRSPRWGTRRRRGSIPMRATVGEPRGSAPTRCSGDRCGRFPPDAVGARGTRFGRGFPVRFGDAAHQGIVGIPLCRARRAREQKRAAGIAVDVEGSSVVRTPLQMHTGRSTGGQENLIAPVGSVDPHAYRGHRRP